jgi:arylsulfatase A-like enzyme
MATTRPNFVVVITDDMRDADWQALPRTRSLVAEQGTHFPNFFLTTPTCSPSRASILTGQYAHNHGVVKNDGRRGGYEEFRELHLDDRSIPHRVRRAGYRTGLFGKFMNGTPARGRVPGGWDEWLVSTEQDYYDFETNDNGKPRSFTKENQYSTDVFANRAAEFIEKTGAEQPFLLFFAPKAPHDPATPRRRDRGAFAGAHLERSPDLNEADISDKPQYVRRNNALGLGGLAKLNRNRLESLIAVDDAVARLVRTLEASGRMAQTYLFVLSDNGYMLGSHRLLTKGVPYQRATQVTMAALGPQFGQGVTDRRIAANIDLAPTIADLAGVGLPHADGLSLTGSEERDAVLLQRVGDFRALRTLDALYVKNETGERELYDYVNDPYELDNFLASWSGHAPSAEAEARAAEMASRLADLTRCAGAACR